jgi:hypothetical protein
MIPENPPQKLGDDDHTTTARLTKVLHQHQFTACLLELSVQNPAAIRGYGQAAERAESNGPFKVGERLDLVCGETQARDSGT